MIFTIDLTIITGCAAKSVSLRRGRTAPIFDVIEARLSVSEFENRIADATVPNAAYSGNLVYRPSPEMNHQPQAADPAIYRLVTKFHPARRDARARALGEAGEAFLFQAEQNRLSACGRDDLAGKVRWVAKEDGDGVARRADHGLGPTVLKTPVYAIATRLTRTTGASDRRSRD